MAESLENIPNAVMPFAVIPCIPFIPVERFGFTAVLCAFAALRLCGFA